MKNNMKYTLAINASRARSGGATSHIIGLLKSIVNFSNNISRIHVWTYPELRERIEKHEKIIIHCPEKLKKNIFYQILWELKDLPKDFAANKCDILLNVDAGTFAKVKPCLTMSRDMLSYEDGVASLFGFSFQRIRIEALRYIQNNSLAYADTPIFLTHYASKVISKDCGNLNHHKIIPHGIGPEFKRKHEYQKQEKKAIRCIYVSNLLPYKHHIELVEAFSILNTDSANNISVDLTIDLDSLSYSKYGQKLNKRIKELNISKYINFIGEKKHIQIPKLIEQYDIFLFASSCENMPNTLIEAMAMKMPIACSDRGPMPEVLRDAGVYFNPQSPESIASAILNLSRDINLRVEFSKKAYILSKNYSWDRCARETIHAIEETLINKAQ